MGFFDDATDLVTPAAWTAESGATTATAPAGSPGGATVIYVPESARCYINTGPLNMNGAVITFWFYFYEGTLNFQLCDFYFGCNGTGAGIGLRLDGRGSGNVGASGFFTSVNFHTATTGSGPIINNPNISGGVGIVGQVWHEVVITVSADGTTASWSLDGTAIQSDVSISQQGGYIGMLGDYATYGAYFAAISVDSTGAGIIAETILDNIPNVSYPDNFTRFRLRGFTGNVPVYSGPIVTVTATLAVGQMSQAIIANSSITPAGTFYTVEQWSNRRITSSANYIFNNDVDLSMATPYPEPPTPPPI